jgi:hypothetical protein
MTRELPPEFDAEATAIDDIREAAFAALHVANVRGVKTADIEALTKAMAEISVRCEVLRCKYFPSCRELFITLGVAIVMSETGCHHEAVWHRAAAERPGES